MWIIGCSVARGEHPGWGVCGGAWGEEQECCMLWLYLFAANLSGFLAMEPPFPVGAEKQQKPQNWETVELLHRQRVEIPGGNQSRHRRNSLLGSTLPANERENSEEGVWRGIITEAFTPFAELLLLCSDIWWSADSWNLRSYSFPWHEMSRRGGFFLFFF